MPLSAPPSLRPTVFSPKRPKQGVAFGILRQQPWEMLITFIISQRKKHPCHQAVCAAAVPARGANPSGMQAMFSSLFPRRAGLRAFPWMSWRPAALATVRVMCMRRHVSAASGALDLAALCQAENAALQQALLAVPGVGAKVANCVMLFGYHRLDGFAAGRVDQPCHRRRIRRPF